MKRSPASLTIATQLVTLEHNDSVRHFGYQILEFHVRENWYQLPGDQQEYYKRFVLTAISSVMVPYSSPFCLLGEGNP